MDRETTLNGAPADESTAPRFSRNARRIAAHAIALAEMQYQLFLRDLSELGTRALWVLVAVLVAAGLIVAVLPTALIGLGFWLADQFSLSTAAGLLWAALAGGVLATLLIIAGWWQFKRRVYFEKSRRELRENLSLLKQILSDPDSVGKSDR